MGVDYSPVAGFSVPMNDELRKKIADIAREKVGKDYDQWESDFDILRIAYCSVGTNYVAGGMELIPIFIPASAVNLDAQLSFWLSDFNDKCLTTFEIKDLIFVRDLFIH